MYCTIKYINVENELDFSKIEGFEWDEGNVNKNWLKHLISSKESEEVFVNKRVYYYDDKHSHIEKRFTVYGITNNGRKLIVIFTIRKSRIRIISARDQNSKERKKYEKEAKINS